MAVNDLVDREERPAWIEFERRAVENKAESLKRGRVVFDDVDYALVTPPYSKDRFEQKVDKFLKQVRINVQNGRTPHEHLEYFEKKYEYWLKGQEAPLNGSPIKDWSAITPAQREMVMAVKIFTVEDLAACNDEGLRRIGMGGTELRNKAKAWLQAEKDHGPLVIENASLKKENEVLKTSVETLEKKLNALTAKVESRVYEEEQTDEIMVADILDETDNPVQPTLDEQYKQVTGRNPHPSASDEAKRKRIAKG